MADKKDEKNSAKPSKKGGGKFGVVMIMVIFGIMSPFIVPTIVLFIAGMLPTLVALVTDTDRQKSTAIAIGSLNFAGVVPFIIDLWVKGQSMPTAIHILTDTTSWLVMLGAAAIGQLIVFALPNALASLTTIRMEARLHVLKQNAESIKTTWGSDVATTTPISKLRPKD